MKILLLSLLLSVQTYAVDKFSYYLEVSIWGDYTEELYEEDIVEAGWSIRDDEYGDSIYVLGEVDITFEGKKAIWERLGDVEFEIRKTARSYKACLGVSVGDADSSADGCAYLHKGVNIIDASGGEYASGMWSFDGRAIIHWK